MFGNEKNWLEHLDNAIPKAAYGYKTCAYTVALEGWRRGLELKFINTFNTSMNAPIKFSLSDGKKQYTFATSRGELVTKEAIKVCIDKDKTKEILSKANVAVPEGRAFNNNNSDEEIINYTKSIGFPVVLKPTNAGGGTGVITNITNIDQFVSALFHVRNELQYKDIMVERYVLGDDYRIYVLNNEIIGAFKRMPANVIGDGDTTIKGLIDKKNKIRKNSPFLFYKPIKVDEDVKRFLYKQNLSVDYIPKKGQLVMLRDKGSFIEGGDPIDVTDLLTNSIKSNAINAVKAVPGLVQCAVDMIVDEENDVGVINELNSKPQISNHLFPSEGIARDIPRAIIDYYFPHTKGEFRNDQFYFDLKSIIENFKNGFAKSIIIPNVPSRNYITRRYVVSGTLSNSKYKSWIMKKAKSLKLNGRVRDLNNGDVVIIAAGLLKNLDEFKETIINNSPDKVHVSGVSQKDWNKPVKIGFEILEK
ncbi:ATP-binding protein, partial [Pontibacillus litoralis]|uniref:ATP-binding protein n=1 Tax=Pontibacillus litoralis TaxID=516703 RepID=UPI00056C420C